MADHSEARERARQEFEEWACENWFSITKANAIDDDVYEDQVTQALHDCWHDGRRSLEQERSLELNELLEAAEQYIRDWRVCDCGAESGDGTFKMGMYNTECGHAIECDYHLADAVTKHLKARVHKGDS